MQVRVEKKQVEKVSIQLAQRDKVPRGNLESCADSRLKHNLL